MRPPFGSAENASIARTMSTALRYGTLVVLTANTRAASSIVGK
jgi:hypothetical protein